MISQLSPKKLEALKTLAPYLNPNLVHNPTFTDWCGSSFYITAQPKPQPMQLMDWQSLIFEWPLNPANNINTILISSVKKMGKTAIASAIARYKAETVGPLGEVFCVANDLKQARSRLYMGAVNSIELDPTYDHHSKTIPGKWRVLQNEATYLPKNSRIQAIPLDYKGEAGANPDLSCWTEFWGFMGDNAKRMWVEFTPPPTKFSQRVVEGYAGYVGESVLWQEQWDIAKGGRQLTIDDVPEWATYFPNEEVLPVWLNEDAGYYALLDQGAQARRMPWQTPDYYREQSLALDANDFDRFHNNFWVSPVSDFLPEAWVNSCIDPNLDKPLAPFVQLSYEGTSSPQHIPLLRTTKPIVLGVDASVSGDCTAVVGVSRHPLYSDHIVVEFVNMWKPEKGKPLDYTETCESAIRYYSKYYNVVCCTYDPYQLHYLMMNLYNEGLVWTDPFPQMNKRLEADKQLYDLFKDRRIHFRGEPEIVSCIKNCSARKQPQDNSKLRIVKKEPQSIIDPVVALSMAAYQCLFLNL